MIIKCALVSSVTLKSFKEQLNEAISMLQTEGLYVEVQYKPANHGGELIFTALLIGRKDVVKE